MLLNKRKITDSFSVTVCQNSNTLVFTILVL